MSTRGFEAVKIVIIDTQYIETDAISFKSIVQRLTGKESIMEAASVELEKNKSHLAAASASISSKCNDAPSLSRGMSFKDINWLLDVELPPLNEELYRLFSN
ncbi:hypothetical protein LIER_13813 [Lithospermum erythrorhizon]|uniref:VQ domain-containing protein n=1 Tax=Lithospermum erythrorhizon TaxID=34254 RepID=A0AAV3PWW3_LITER